LKFLLLLAPLLLLASAQLQVSYLLLASLLFLISPVAGVPGLGEFLAVTGHSALLLASVLVVRFPFFAGNLVLCTSPLLLASLQGLCHIVACVPAPAGSIDIVDIPANGLVLQLLLA
jgi:hypothetical protein